MVSWVSSLSLHSNIWRMRMFEKIMKPVELLGEIVESSLCRLVNVLDGVNIKRFM